jgi:hypothetical protein
MTNVPTMTVDDERSKMEPPTTRIFLGALRGMSRVEEKDRS